MHFRRQSRTVNLCDDRPGDPKPLHPDSPHGRLRFGKDEGPKLQKPLRSVFLVSNKGPLVLSQLSTLETVSMGKLTFA